MSSARQLLFTALTLALALALCAARADSARADLLPPQIHTLAGGGSCKGSVLSGGACDGVAATKASILGARSVAALPGGAFLYIDEGNDLIREVSALGVVTTVAGNGTSVDEPDGSLAINSGLDGPVSVAPLANGGFLITEFGSSEVRMVSPGTPATATITTIAGTGVAGDNGLQGPATSIELNYPTDAQPTPSGGVLIADTYNNEIRLLSAAASGATISTIAGGGTCDDVSARCDGIAAGAVALDHPDSVSPQQDGSGGYLFAEYDGDAVRAVSALSPAGTFSTLAGIPGSAGYSGDGGPAVAATLNHPDQVLATPGGGFLIADTGNEVVRQVSPSGVISMLAGNRVATFAGDGGDATAASLLTPAAVALATDGNGGILLADQDNDRVREITIPSASSFTLDPPVPNGANGWYTTSVTATVSATENATIRCVLDPGGAPPAYGAFLSSCGYLVPTTITGNGRHLLYAASENSFGDQENPVSVTVNIDVGPPTVTCGAPRSFPYGTPGAQVTAILADAVSGPASELVSAPADTMILGAQQAVVSGANVAGTLGQATCDYTVTPVALTPAPATSAAFTTGPGATTVKRLAVRDVPVSAAVTVTCDGVGCPFSVRRGVPVGGCSGHGCPRGASGASEVDLTALFARRRLEPGTRVTVSVTRQGAIGRQSQFTIGGAGKHPTSRSSCLAPGSLSAQVGC